MRCLGKETERERDREREPSNLWGGGEESGRRWEMRLKSKSQSSHLAASCPARHTSTCLLRLRLSLSVRQAVSLHLQQGNARMTS